MMSIDDKIGYKFFYLPQFLTRSIYVIFNLGRSGFFSEMLKLNIFERNFQFIIKILVFLFEKKNLLNKEESIYKSLSELGPGFIKFGQALSTRPDIIGTKITRKLVFLQDKLEPFSTKLAIKTLERDLGLPLNKIFKKFDPKPIASASVAQVHSGTLITGEKVAIKILRPNIELKLFKDFKYFYCLSIFVTYFAPKLKSFKLPEMVKIFAEASLNEVNLKLEGASCDELKENFQNHKNFYVPKIYWEYTSRNVLVLEFIEGKRIDEISKYRENFKKITKLTKLASEIFFLQVFRDGFFHADLHPGNILIDHSDRIVPVDFGIMGRLNNKDRKFLAELLINLLDKNFYKVTKLHEEYDMLGKNVPHDLLTQEIRSLSLPILDKPIGEISLSTLLGEILSLSKKFDIAIQPKFCLLQKTMVMAEGMARQLNPDANMWQLTRPLVEKWIKDNFDPFNQIEDWISENKKIILSLPEFFHDLKKLIEQILKKG